MKKIVLIRGPPASGKTTLAEQVGKRIKGKYVVLHKDDFDFEIPHRGKYKINPLIHLMTEYFLEEGFNVVIEGVYGGKGAGKRIALLKSLAKKRKATFVLIFLHTEKNICLNRNKTREKHIPEKDVHKWHKYLYKCEAEKGIIINNNNITKRQALKKIMIALRTA